MKYKRQSVISKGSLDRMLKAADAAWKRRKFSEALELLERASRLHPSHAGMLLDLGRMHGLRYNRAAAEGCLDQAVRVAPNKTETLTNAGFQAMEFSDFALSERYYLQAAAQPDASAEVFVRLAKLYERVRRTDEAAAMVDRALHRASTCPEALLTRARLERQAGRIESAEQIIRDFVTRPNPDVWILSQSWYEFGAILDRQGKYDEAMNAFIQAKALLQPQAGRFLYELKIVRQRITDLKANLTPETIQRWLDSWTSFAPSRPLALLGGHPRSGTTLLEQVLDSHPGMISLEETEIFHDDAYCPLVQLLPEETPMLSALEAAPTETLQRSRANYFQSVELFLGQPLSNRLLIDKNPSLTFLIPALIRIFPEIKLLIALRDPRDVVLSSFMQPMPLGQGSSAYLTIESAVDEYISMMNLWRSLKLSLGDRFLEVRYEDMVEDLESVARETLNFLGMPWDNRVLGFNEHARKKVVRSPTYADVTQPVYKRAVGRWRNYQSYLDPHLEKLDPLVKVFGYG